MSNEIHRYAYFQQGCATLMTNSLDLLRLADEPESFAAILKILRTMPLAEKDLKDPQWRESYCNRLMGRAYTRCISGLDKARFQELMAYFLEDIPSYPLDARYMLEAAFNGILRQVKDRPLTGFDVLPEESSIALDCPDCKRAFSIDQRHAGKRVRCKDCGCVMMVPIRT